jgi:carboxynorspermidine decarboxylase
MIIKTPYYLIDERKLLRNLKMIQYVRKNSGAKVVLALKCFSTWSVFDLMKKYMDGTTSSSAYEARLGFEKFGKEVHAYCVAYSPSDVKEVVRFSDKIIFNSVSQLENFYPYAKKKSIGIRVNPGLSYSSFDLADPSRKFSRLGVIEKSAFAKILSKLNGFMFHFNCENDDFKNFSDSLDKIGRMYGDCLKQLQWVSLGGGIYFTKKNYPLDSFCKKLKNFSKRFNIQVYLEPGESAITQSAELVTTVLDIVHNRIDVAIVDASVEAHMLDLLIYRLSAKMEKSRGKYKYMVAGRSCLAGDVFGTYRFKARLKVGSIIKFSDAAGYSIVKKNWFNGLDMPAIVLKKIDGSQRIVRHFNYKDFVESQS